MKKLILSAVVGFLGFNSFCQEFKTFSNFPSEVKVDSYVKTDGTVVKEHWRTAPDNSFNNNWSTKGNMNPHTGEWGTKTSKSTFSTNRNFNSSPSFNYYQSDIYSTDFYTTPKRRSRK